MTHTSKTHASTPVPPKEAARCPFCGSVDLTNYSQQNASVVACQTCGACGPVGMDAVQAWDLWGRRSRAASDEVEHAQPLLQGHMKVEARLTKR